MTLQDEQQRVCEQAGLPFLAAPQDSKVGIARNVREGLFPIHGMRHRPRGDATGWYLWAGDVLSEEPDFFQPLHVAHLASWRPMVLKYLGLAPGARFLLADGYEDIWFDESLLTEDVA